LRILDAKFRFEKFCQILDALASSTDDHSRLRRIDYDSSSDWAFGEFDSAVAGSFQISLEQLVDLETSRDVFDEIFGN